MLKGGARSALLGSACLVAMPALSVLLGSCSIVAESKKAATDWVFQPPSGWPEFQGALGLPAFPLGGGLWQSPGGPAETVSLMIIAGRKPLSRSMLGTSNATYKNIKVCDGVPAIFVQSRSTWPDLRATDTLAEQQPSSIAIAVYKYPVTSTPSPEAESSLRSLCPRPKASTRP